MKSQEQIMKQLSDKELYMNLFATQCFLLTIALTLAFFLQGSVAAPFQQITVNLEGTIAGLVFAAIILILQAACYYIFPASWLDDGGINKRIFSKMPLPYIVFFSGFIALTEEILFRGVLQTQFGLVAASIIFALIHVRYLKNWFLFIYITGISFALGGLFLWTGNLWTVLVAHFTIDLVLGLLIRYNSNKL